MDDRHPEPLTPSLLLAFWRQRWGKPATKTLGTPYLHGQIVRLGHWLTHGSAWSLPGLAACCALTCLMLFGVLVQIQFPLNGQLIFSVLVIGLALYANLFAGTFVTLVLMGLISLLLARYFYWRLDATLAPEFGADMVCGLVLCAAELHLWALMTVDAIRAAWPVREPAKRLPIEQGGWPSVDVLVLCAGRSTDAVQSTLLAVGALSWHPKKLNIFVLDSAPRENVQVLATSIGATYLTDTAEVLDELARINQTLSVTQGEVIGIVDGDSAPHPGFLKATVGWFLYDPQLGMLQTPGHFLAPKPARRILEIFKTVGPTGSYALIRRSMLKEAALVEGHPSLTQTHLALKLQELAASSSYLGFIESAESLPDDDRSGAASRPVPEAFRIFRPYGDTALLWKLRLTSLEAWLTFYRPLAHWVFFLTPVAYLLFDVRVIQTSAYLWLAYALPQFVLGLIVQDRRHREQRTPLWADMREMLLSWHLLVLTSWTLIRTEVTKLINILRASDSILTPYEWKSAMIPIIGFALSAASVVAGTTQLHNPHSKLDEWTVLFVCWSLYNLTILLGRLAMAEENREVHHHLQSQRHLPAMIRLPSGRTMSCRTENFPESALKLRLPAAVPFGSGSTTSVSIFHRNREYSFPVRVTSHEGAIVSAQIDGAALNVYRSLGVAAYSRGRDWPKWLPDRDADQIVPTWLGRALVALRPSTDWLTKGFDKLASVIRSVKWIHKGKKKT